MGEKTEARLLDDAGCARMLPARPRDAHKGTFGTLACVCGSLDYAGAALLCSLSAARAGTGLVALAVPRSLQPLFSGRVREAITIGLPETEAGGDIDPAGARDALAERSLDALVIGPGLRESDGYGELLLSLLEGSGPPLVVDGSALNILSRSGEWWRVADRACVLTPHPGEFARITGAAVSADAAERLQRATDAARLFGQVVVLKGAGTVICAADGRQAVSPFATPALATAGSGDVLAGLIGGLLAQGMAAFEAACLGVYMHASAGERIARTLGDSGLLASDLPHEIALVRHDLAALA